MDHFKGVRPIVISGRPRPWLLIYAQAEEGYRAPGINTAAAPGEKLAAPGGREPLRAFKGDELWSIEAGAKLTALNGRLRLDVAGYETEWRDIQSDQLLASGLPYTANVGRARNLGLEVEAAFMNGPLEVRAEMLLDSPVLARANPAFPVLANTGLGAVPDESFGVSARYSWALGRHRSVELDGRWAYIGESHLMLDVASLPQMGNYSTGRLAASLVDPHWRATLAVDNPVNTVGDTFAYGNPFTVRTKAQTTPLRPRTITLTVEASF